MSPQSTFTDNRMSGFFHYWAKPVKTIQASVDGTIELRVAWILAVRTVTALSKHSGLGQLPSSLLSRLRDP
jgi:hypothetical protein